MRSANLPGIYDKVLLGACHLKTSLIFTFSSAEAFDSSYFHFVDQVDHYCNLASRKGTEAYGCEMGGASGTLKQYTETLDAFIRAKQLRGIRGLKFAIAYVRTLAVEQVDEEEAERLYDSLPMEAQSSPAPVPRRLQDYLIAKILSICENIGMPVRATHWQTQTLCSCRLCSKGSGSCGSCCCTAGFHGQRKQS